MVYPPPPWQLKGHALITLQWVDIEQVRSQIPEELELVSIWPGKTLGVVYLSSYRLGSVMEYNELIVACGPVKYAGKLGSWISHIYVDNPNSVAGGREIWGLPKEMAEFRWEDGQKPRVQVTQGNRQLCSLSYSQPSIALPIPFSGDVLSRLGSNWLLFKGQLQAQIGPIGGHLEIPVSSPFAYLNLSQPWLTIACQDLNLVVSEPQIL